MAYGAIPPARRARVGARTASHATRRNGGKRPVAASSRLVNTFYVPPQYGLGDSADEFGQFGGFSLKGLVKGIGGVVKKVAKPLVNTAVNFIPGGQAIRTGVQVVSGAFHTSGSKPAQPTSVTLTPQQVAGTLPINIVNSALRAASAQPNINVTPSSQQVAAASDATAQALAAAEAARKDAAAQVAAIQAQLDAAKRAGQDAQAAALQRQVAEATKQAAAATQAAQAAADAARGASSGVDVNQLQALVNAAASAANAAQTAAAAPPTPQGTAQAQGAANAAVNATGDASSSGGGFSLGGNTGALVLGAIALAVLAGRRK